MIDRRLLKVEDHEKDIDLQSLTDTDILLNFGNTLKDLYPHLIPIAAFAYDSWDEIVMPLFFEMVHRTFAYKYGINVKPNEYHTYSFTLHCYKKIHHIECILKQDKTKGYVNGELTCLHRSDLSNKLMIFKSFGDRIHSLTMGIELEDAKQFRFDMVEVEIVCKETGYRFLKHANDTIFLPKDSLLFEFVAETYDKAEHECYKTKYV
ncbi:hypothetical protein ACFVWC_29695 [Bacillus mycoides]|uniref:hypothetical protein n=1 Tax=Bacillus TaxID=1386 RepID=UPI001913CAA7|nr:hypothetical protein [Bacillus sp. TH25]MBK5432150.1 hypothetical protein [Bacillus sp. TH25]